MQVVDSLVQEIYDGDESSKTLEEWASSASRAKSVFGSSAFHDARCVKTYCIQTLLLFLQPFMHGDVLFYIILEGY